MNNRVGQPSPHSADNSAHFRVGLVGAGYISEFHVAALRRLPNVEIVGVHDLDGPRAEILAQKEGLRVFPSIEALCQGGANVIHVLTPPNVHTAVALEAIDHGCHVFVEKPLATEVEDCNRIERAADAKGVQVCVNHSLLFDPQVRRALQVVQSGKLGDVVSLDILRSSVYPPYPGGPLPPQYRAAGYPFRDLGVHALYIFEAFLGPIEDVQASWKNLGGEPNLSFDEWRAQVRCSRGIGQFQLSWNVKPLQSQMILQGTRGVLRVDLFLMFNALRRSLPLPKSIERILNALSDSLKPMVDVPLGVYGFLRKKILPYHGLQDLIRAFYLSLESATPVPVSVGEARRVVLWTERIAQAADAEQRAVRASFAVSESVPYLVTGASGKLGGAIVRRLREEGHRVRMLVRRVPDKVLEGTDVVIGDLGDPDSVVRAVRGAEVVIHAGAAMRGGWVEHQRGTILGTKNLLEACAQYGVGKLVHISSMSVVRWADAGRDEPISEDSDLEPRAEDRGSYTRAKLEAEQLVRNAASQGRVRAVILRPGQIFGGGMPVLTPAVARRIGSRWMVLGDGELRLPLVHIDDVVDAVVRAAESSLGKGEVIQLVHPESLTQNQVLQLAVSEHSKIVRVPRVLVFTLGWMSEIALGLLKRKSPLSVYRLRSALSRRSFTCLGTALLGDWAPALPIQDQVIENTEDRPGRVQRARPAPTVLAGVVVSANP